MRDSRSKSSLRNDRSLGRGVLRRRRRGVAVVLVLGLLALTLALSYSMLRGQAMTAELQRNRERTVDARYAAEAGMSAALRRMHEPNWSGVDVPWRGTIDSHTYYDVTYATGDESLSASSPDWQEYPFRVTVRVAGYAEDPSQPTLKSSHKLETVVQLVRRRFQSDSGPLGAVQTYALYQWATDDQRLELPFRVEGNAFMLGRMRFAEAYPPTTQRTRYLSDLNAMRIAGLGDYRPFGGGTVTLKYARQPSGLLTLLTTQLGLSAQNTNATSNQPVAPPATVNKYRLYPGGKEYDVPSLQQAFGAVMQNAVAAPDPVTNPLGLFRSDSWMTFGNNARVTGTILSPGSSSDMSITGTGVQLKGYTLPPLEGSNEKVQLPALMVRDDLRVHENSNTIIEGLAVVWDELEIGEGSANTQFRLQGKLLTRSLQIRERREWDNVHGTTWTTSLVLFLGQLIPLNPRTIYYYPQYMQQHVGLAYQPKLTVKPNSDGVRYHWQDWNQPIYVKGTGDTGLRWNVVSQRVVE